MTSSAITRTAGQHQRLRSLPRWPCRFDPGRPLHPSLRVRRLLTLCPSVRRQTPCPSRARQATAVSGQYDACRPADSRLATGPATARSTMPQRRSRPSERRRLTTGREVVQVVGAALMLLPTTPRVATDRDREDQARERCRSDPCGPRERRAKHPPCSKRTKRQ
jgi:hypothetical protein